VLSTEPAAAMAPEPAGDPAEPEQPAE